MELVNCKMNVIAFVVGGLPLCCALVICKIPPQFPSKLSCTMDVQGQVPTSTSDVVLLLGMNTRQDCATCWSAHASSVLGSLQLTLFRRNSAECNSSRCEHSNPSRATARSIGTASNICRNFVAYCCLPWPGRRPTQVRCVRWWARPFFSNNRQKTHSCTPFDIRCASHTQNEILSYRFLAVMYLKNMLYRQRTEIDHVIVHANLRHLSSDDKNHVKMQLLNIIKQEPIPQVCVSSGNVMCMACQVTVCFACWMCGLWWCSASEWRLWWFL